MSDSHELERRDFVKVVMLSLGTIMGVAVGLPAIAYLISPAAKTQASDVWIPVGKMEAYETGVPTLYSFTRTKTNGWEKTVNSYGVYVVKQNETEALAYSNMCTHLSCRVTWQEGAQEYVCPCHDGRFDTQGQVVAGPPPRPLDQYPTKVEDGTLYIHFTEA